MDCQDVYKLMNRYIDDEISPEEEKVLEFHLERCRDCQKEFGELKEMNLLLNTMEPSANFTDQVMNQIQKQKHSYRRWMPRTRKGWLSWVAAILFFVFLIPPFFSKQNDPELVIRSGQVESSVDETGTEKFEVIDGEILVKNLEGTLHAVNSKIFFEKVEAEVEVTLWDQIKYRAQEILNKIKELFK